MNISVSAPTVSHPALVPPVGVGRIRAVASGKGGVGKTFLAIALAQALAQLGQRVLLFDADLGLANVDIQLGLLPRHDLGALVAGRATLPDIVLPFAAGGFDIIAGRSGSGALSALAPATLDATLVALRQLAAGYDQVLLDLGAGIDWSVRRMAAWADDLLLVATDDPTSLTDAYAVLKTHAADAGPGRRPAGIIINQARSAAAGAQTYATLARASENFLGRSPALCGVVRSDDRVRDAIRRQTPLLTRHPNSPAASDIGALAQTLLRSAAPG